MNDRDIQRAVGALLDLAPLPPDEPGPSVARARHPRRSPAAIAAVAVAFASVSVGGLVAVAHRGTSSSVVAPTSTSTPTAPSSVPVRTALPTMLPSPASATPGTTSASTTSASTAPSGAPTATAEPADLPGWYLPRVVPDGWDLTQLQASVATRPVMPNADHNWYRFGADGSVGATLRAIATRVPPEAQSAVLSPPAATEVVVAGQPATAWDALGMGQAVSWLVDGVRYELYGRLTRDEVVAAANAVVTGTQPPSIELPAVKPDAGPLAGFAPLPLDRSVPDRAVSMTASYRRPGASVSFLDVSIYPNFDSLTLPTMVNPDGGGRIETVGAHTAVVSSHSDEYGTLTSISWLDHGFVVSVGGRPDEPTTLAFAASIERATLAEVRAAGDAITTAALALSVLDEADLADGRHVSVRTIDGRGAVALCFDAPRPRCRVSNNVDQPDAADAAFFDFGGSDRRTILGWRQGHGGPTIASVSPDVAAASTIDEVVAGAKGDFVRASFPPLRNAPGFAYGSPPDQRFYGLGDVALEAIIDA